MSRDLELMEHADGEAEVELTGEGRAKIEAVHELGELVRGRLERAADDVPDVRFGAMWKEIDKEIDKQLDLAKAPAAIQPKRTASPGLFRRITSAIERYRSHIITGVVSAGAVAALALVLHGGSTAKHDGHDPIDVQRVSHRPAEIEDLDTPGGTGTVFNLDDEDGSTTVIWVTPEDTVEGI